MMLERIALLAAALLAGWVLAQLWRAWQAQRVAALAAHGLPGPLVGRVERGRPAVLYFTAEHCVQCRLQQAPVLAQLARTEPVTVLPIDAVEQPELADYFGVMTVPTTVWLDRSLRPAAVNHGVAPLARLREQLAKL